MKTKFELSTLDCCNSPDYIKLNGSYIKKVLKESEKIREILKSNCLDVAEKYSFSPCEYEFFDHNNEKWEDEDLLSLKFCSIRVSTFSICILFETKYSGEIIEAIIQS